MKICTYTSEVSPLVKDERVVVGPCLLCLYFEVSMCCLLTSVDTILPFHLQHNGHNLLKVSARDQYVYARTLLYHPLHKRGAKSSLLYKSARSTKEALGEDEVDLSFSKYYMYRILFVQYRHFKSIMVQSQLKSVICFYKYTGCVERRNSTALFQFCITLLCSACIC